MRFGQASKTLRRLVAFLWVTLGLGWLPFVHGAATATPVTVVDLMVLYTPQARVGAGGGVAIESQIEIAVFEANYVLQNSRASVRVRLVHRQEIAYSESGALATDLARLRLPQDGFLDQAHALRDQYAADVVCLVTESGSDYSFYGLQGPSAASAFGAIRRRYLTGDYYFPVVLGFNFGCQLERPYADSVGAFPFSYGYTGLTDLEWFSSVEAFDGTRLPYFSNPDIVLGGEGDASSFRLGVPEGLPGAANNTKTLNRTAPIVATFRGAAPTTLPPSVVFVTPTNGTTVAVTNELTLAVQTSDPDGAIRRVDFFLQSESGATRVLLGSRTNSPWSLTVQGFPEGRSFLLALAVDDIGASSYERTLIEATNVPPSNDDFANRAALDGTNLTVRLSTSLATREPDEPDYAGVAGGHSVWWIWTAPVAGKARFRTTGSDFSTVLTVYTGESLTNLTLVAQDVYYERSEVLFRVEAGTAYQIVVDGYRFSDAEGDLVLSLDYPAVPSNDDFSQRAVLVGNAVEIHTNNLFTTHEPGELMHGWNRGRGSLWWQWTAPARGGVEVLVSSSPAQDRFATVYTGATLTNLTPVGHSGRNQQPARIVFDVEAGQAFSLAVDSSNYYETAGPFTLQWIFHPPPSNDDFTNRTLLIGNHVVLTNSNVAATPEFGEPMHAGNPPVNTLWWTWTAPADGLLTLDAPRGHALGAYTGATLTNLTDIASGTHLVFAAQAGTTYQIAADGAEGDVILELLFSSVRIVSPANEARFVTGSEVPIVVTATAGDGLIQWLELYADGVLIGAGANAPLQFTWSNAPPGAHTLTATAFTADGLQRQSLPVHLAIRPPNDDFTNSFLLSGVSLVTTASNIGATSEPDEPDLGLPGNGSLWWHWTAPAHGRVTLDFQGSDFGPVVSAYLGDTVSNLALVARADTSRGIAPIFDVEPGRIYRLQIVNPWNVEAGRIVMALSFAFAPPNDDFTNSFPLSGISSVTTGSNIGASNEPGEPDLGLPGVGSLWWHWTAPASGRVTLDFHGSDFDPVVSAYLGEVVSNLTLVARADTSTGVAPVFEVEPGLTYHLQIISPWNARAGRIVLAMSFASASLNDNFADRVPLAGTNLFVSGSNTDATTEPGEPAHAGAPPSHSLWWTYTAPGNGGVTVTLEGNPFNTAIQIYTGSTLTNLNPIIGNRSNGKVSFNVAAGHDYLIVMNALGGIGTVAFRLFYALPSANDSFLNRIALTGGALSVTATNSFASRESGEPDHASQPGGASVWWSWTAPASGFVVITNAPEGFDALLAVYTGGSVSNLVRVAAGASNSVAFEATAGVTYAIAIDGASGATGRFTFTLNEIRVRITQPVSGSMIPNRDGISLAVEVGGVAGAVQSVSFFTGAELIGTRTAPPFTLLWSNAVSGPHTLTATVLFNDGSTSTSAPVLVTLVSANDNFVDRLVLPAGNVLAQGDNRFATSEAGEPLLGGATGRTVWWSWTAPTNGLLTIDTTGSDFRRIDPRSRRTPGVLVAVFTGDTLTNLALVSSNSYLFSEPHRTEWRVLTDFSLLITTGTTYQISVDGVNQSLGDIALNLQFYPAVPPANDDFDRRASLASDVVGVDVSNYFATREPGEPLHAGEPGGASVWWSWTAPVTGSARLTVASPFASVAAVYAGDSVGTLAEVAHGTGELTFACTAGATYQIAVDGVGGAVGKFQFDLTTTARPPNDRFADRLALSGTSISVDGTTVEATREPGEALHPASVTGASVWYSWTAPSSGDVTVLMIGLDTAQPFAIHAGSVLTDLLRVAQATDADGFYEARFYALAGVTYQIAVSDNNGVQGAFSLALIAAPPAPNLDAAVSVRLPDGSFRLRVTGTNGQGFVLQASINLRDWTTLTVDTLLGDVFDYTDADAAFLMQRFYRVVPLEALYSPGPLRVASGVSDGSGAFVVRVTGPAAQPFVLQASGDLLGWSDLTRGWLIGETLDYPDPDAAHLPQRFYRAVPLR